MWELSLSGRFCKECSWYRGTVKMFFLQCTQCEMYIHSTPIQGSSSVIMITKHSIISTWKAVCGSGWVWKGELSSPHWPSTLPWSNSLDACKEDAGWEAAHDDDHGVLHCSCGPSCVLPNNRLLRMMMTMGLQRSVRFPNALRLPSPIARHHQPQHHYSTQPPLQQVQHVYYILSLHNRTKT